MLECLAYERASMHSTFESRVQHIVETLGFGLSDEELDKVTGNTFYSKLRCAMKFIMTGVVDSEFEG